MIEVIKARIKCDVYMKGFVDTSMRLYFQAYKRKLPYELRQPVRAIEDCWS